MIFNNSIKTLLLVSLCLLCSCGSDDAPAPAEESATTTVTPTSTSISIDSAAASTTSTSVTLTLAATDAAGMYITNTAGCESGGTSEVYSTSKAWTLGQTDSTATVYIKYTSSTGDESTCISDTITHDSTAPTSTSISIDAGATSTNSTSVALTLAATDATDMYITDTAGCGSGGAYETYSTSKAWTLGQIDSTATVYSKFKDEVGNETSCISDTITHASIAGDSFVMQLGDTTFAIGGDNSGGESCRGVDVDEQGNVYCAGITNGDLGELNGGGNDAFISKANYLGELQWVFQLGSVSNTTGSSSGSDACLDVVVDTSGNVYCAGSTTGNLWEANAGSPDAFVMKLDSSGSLVWVTHLGTTTAAVGGSNSGSEQCQSVDVDINGNVYCAGQTSGDMGETNDTSTDAFILKLDPSGAIVWLTQLGTSTVDTGGSNSGADQCNAVKVDSGSNVYCAGSTQGDMGETNGGNKDAFLMKLDSSGNLTWLTHFGATTKFGAGSNSGSDECHGVDVDSDGNVYCAGYTTGSMGEAGTLTDDVVVLKVSSAGVPDWITQLGAVTKAGGDNTSTDQCRDVFVNSSDEVVCVGYTGSSMSEVNGGPFDAIALKLSNTGSIEWLTQFGAVTTAPGGSNSGHEASYGGAVDISGNVYGGGGTWSDMAETNGGNEDIFIFRLDSNGDL